MQNEKIRNLTTMFMYFNIFFAVFVLRTSPILSKNTLEHDPKIFNVFEYTNQSFTHAESPAWDPSTNTLYWVDVLNQNVHALEYGTNRHRVKHICYGEINIVLPIANSTRVLVGVRSEVYLLDWDKPGDLALRHLAVLDLGKPDNILNEGKADALGRFWGGTKGPQIGDTVSPDQGALYSLEPPHFMPRVRLKPVSISNGLVWALNSSVLYYIDSATRKIDALDFDLREGLLSRRRTVIDMNDYGYHRAIADGMTIDIDGFLWVALMFEGMIIRIDPNSKSIVERFHLPVSRVTSMAWAGKKLDHLVVTTSRRNMAPEMLAKEPLSGSIFVLYQMGTSGVPDHKFVFPDADKY